MKKQELKQKLFFELRRSQVADETTRRYWFNNFEKLPQSASECFYDELVSTNHNVDDLVYAGISRNSKLKDEILHKSRTAKRKTFSYLEQEHKRDENPDQFLDMSLN